MRPFQACCGEQTCGTVSAPHFCDFANSARIRKRRRRVIVYTVTFASGHSETAVSFLSCHANFAMARPGMTQHMRTRGTVQRRTCRRQQKLIRSAPYVGFTCRLWAHKVAQGCSQPTSSCFVSSGVCVPTGLHKTDIMSRSRIVHSADFLDMPAIAACLLLATYCNLLGRPFCGLVMSLWQAAARGDDGCTLKQL